jgi:hypothetical protein
LEPSAAGAGDDAAFSQFSSGDVAADWERRTKLSPEAQRLIAGNEEAIEAFNGKSEVVDFAEGEELFVGIRVGVEGGA